MKVLKFGGTSMGSAMAMINVKRIVEKNSEPVALVVSAVGGVTDRLIRTARQAEAKGEYNLELEALKEMHLQIIQELFTPSAGLTVENQLTPVWNELEAILKGVELTGELSAKSYDTITGCGERFSSIIISHFITDARLIDSRQIIKTEPNGKGQQVRFDKTFQNIASLRKELGNISIFPGYIASDGKGENTTLGRGGSDYSAAILAAGLEANILEIWTDVDGFMSADPRIISRAYTLDHLTYAEAMELSHFGAKVIYPPTIIPVLQKRIPVLIKNTFHPEAAGTLIDQNSSEADAPKVKGISSIKEMVLITVQGMGMIGVSGISMRLFKALAGENINVVLISQASSENSISVVVSAADVQAAQQALLDEFEVEIQRQQINGVLIDDDMAVVAVVGEGMKHTTGVSGQLFNSIGKNGVNVYAIAQGASELNISFVVKSKDLRKALNVVHEAFFLSHYQVLHLYLAGVGTVGKNLLEKLERQAQRLMETEKLKIRLVGLANSRQMVFNPSGFSANEAIAQLADGQPGGVDRFVEQMVQHNFSNSVFVDCTASEQVAGQYQYLLEHNISVITANKIASSSAYSHYQKLKKTAREKGVKYLFETNVGAGLPIINTINSLLNSGDRIVELEGVLSGTLNYIVNNVSAERKLSQVVKEAKEKGYSEPDPRIDLKGTDVLRKLLILARECDYPMEEEDIEMESFLPAEFFRDEPVEAFMERLKDYDDAFEQMRCRAEEKGMIWRYTAALKEGKARVGFSEVDKNHPFFHLEDSNNKVLLRSDYYFDHPMEIKGYGAGADVTAAGVFADIIKVANL